MVRRVLQGQQRISALHPVQQRPCRCPSPNSIQSSRVTRPGRLSQSSDVHLTPAIRVRASGRHRPGYFTPGRLLVPLMSIVCVSGSSSAPQPDAPAASRCRGGLTSPVNPPDPSPAKLARSCWLSARPPQAQRGDDLHDV
jgi:hypothetical protein